jgi:hypothetical protein
MSNNEIFALPRSFHSMSTLSDWIVTDSLSFCAFPFLPMMSICWRFEGFSVLQSSDFMLSEKRQIKFTVQNYSAQLHRPLLGYLKLSEKH